MIEMKSVSFSYGETTVFSNLSATFRPGSFYGIVGINGCGKTTLIRLLSALNSPTTGDILLDGRPYREYRRKDLAKHLSLLPQSSHLPAITVEELVSRGRYPYEGFFLGRTEADRIAVENALAQAGVLEFAHRDLSTLSGGERQRVRLAFLLAQDTPYVFLDEPTTYLDISQRFSFMEQLNCLKKQGKCIVAVLHDLSLALRYCDTVAVLNQGNFCAFDSPQNLISSGILEEVFSVRCLPVESDGQNNVLFLPK